VPRHVPLPVAASMMHVPDAALRDILIGACSTCTAIVRARAVNCRWKQTIGQALKLPVLRYALGCHRWDGRLRLRSRELMPPPSVTSHFLELACACWIPAKDALLCLFCDDDCNESPVAPQCVLFAGTGQVQGEWAMDGLRNARFTCGASMHSADNSNDTVAVLAGATAIVVTCFDITGRVHRTFEHAAPVTRGTCQIAFSLDAQFVAVLHGNEGVDEEQRLQVLDVRTGEVAWMEGDDSGDVQTIAFVKRGLLIGCGFTLRLVEAHTGRELASFDNRVFQTWLAVSPNGDAFSDFQFVYTFVDDEDASASTDCELRVKHLCRDQELLKPDGANIYAVWLPDNSKILVIYEDDVGLARLDVIDSKTGVLVWRRPCSFRCGQYTGVFRVSSDGCCLSCWQSGMSRITILMPALLEL